MLIRRLTIMVASILLAGAMRADGPRSYHEVTIAALAAGHVRHTHVVVEGYVSYVRFEEDGDLHIRLCDAPDVKGMNRHRCVIAECIPELPCPPPDIGSKVAVAGIGRFDRENGHKWGEIHPVLKGYW